MPHTTAHPTRTYQCMCEHIAHFPDETGPNGWKGTIKPMRAVPPFHAYGSKQVGTNSCAYVGEVCDECAKTHMARFLVKTD
jgi:hypothetical protein